MKGDKCLQPLPGIIGKINLCQIKESTKTYLGGPLGTSKDWHLVPHFSYLHYMVIMACYACQSYNVARLALPVDGSP